MDSRRPSLPNSESHETVRHWLDGLRGGDDVTAQELWNQYFARLALFAQSRLSKLTREVSGEDIALSAIKSVMIGVRENRFPELSDRNSLWPLLVTITARKAVSEQRRQLAQKRSRMMECQPEDVRDYIGVEPTPEFAVEVSDELERLVRVLGDSTLREIVELKLAGYTNEEIAEKFACATRTVIRKLNRVRQEWRAATGADEGLAGEL